MQDRLAMFADALARTVTAGRRAYLAGGAGGALPLALAGFEQLMEDAAVPARHYRLLREGMALAPAFYADAASGLARPEAVRSLYAQGVSVALDRIDRLVPAIRMLADALAARLGRDVNANSYLTGGMKAALSAHCDGHDVLVVQIAGAKHWRCFGMTVDPIGPEGHRADVTGRTPAWEGIVAEGDVLYLPRGEIHCAAPVRTPSLHLSLRIKSSLNGALAESEDG
jgi:lysine-specific demethylase/histidyl-hydroxylase NO66